MANRYWRGGTGTWDALNTANWSDTSGGAGGFSVPTSADSVFFDQAATYTVTCTGSIRCLDFTVSAGTVTFVQGTAPNFGISGSMSLISGTVWAATGTVSFTATTTGKTVTTNGTAFSGPVTFNGAGGGWTLGSALTTGFTSGFSVSQGTFNSANYAITCGTFNSTGSSVRTLNLGSSTITFGVGTTGAIFTTTGTNITFNAGTSTFISSQQGSTFNGGGLTFYNVSFTNTIVSTTWTILGANTFNNFSISGLTAVGIKGFTFTNDQTINGTLTLGAGTNSGFRTFLSSSNIGAQRTLTCAAISSVTDVDFRDINFAGAISLPVTGTRLGDCKGNNNITFDAPKTVYYARTSTTLTWGVSVGAWSLTSGGAINTTAFPLAQDTAVFPAATYPASGATVTLNANYNIGTIDMSLKTSNTMTLSLTNLPTIYGDWINGTGTLLSSTGTLTFAGRGSQTIRSSGVSFSQPIVINSPSGSVTLQDSHINTNSTGFTWTAGTFSANTYNVTLPNAKPSSTGSVTRSINFGSGTWVFGTSGTIISLSGSNITVAGTGTISLTSASAKTFTTFGLSWSGLTISQDGIGDLTFTGSGSYGNITNTVQPATVLFTAGTTTTFTNFSLSGTAGNLITIGSVTAASHTLSKASGTVSGDYLSISRSTATGGALWYAGANSTNGGNNTGWIFTAPPSGYTAGGQFFAFF